jgi:hypothetical protein
MGRCELPETSQNKRGSTYRVCCSRWLDRARHRSRNAGKTMSTYLTRLTCHRPTSGQSYLLVTSSTAGAAVARITGRMAVT